MWWCAAQSSELQASVGRIHTHRVYLAEFGLSLAAKQPETIGRCNVSVKLVRASRFCSVCRVKNGCGKGGTGRTAGGVFCWVGFFSMFCQAGQPLATVELPIKLRGGDLLVETRINGSEPLLFKLDTGFGITTVHPNRVESLHLEQVGHMTIIGIAGEEQADTYAKAVFDFNGATYTPRRIASLPSDARRRWRKRDGILGEGFFRRFVVEIDVAKQRLRLFEPKTLNITASAKSFPSHSKRTRQ